MSVGPLGARPAWTNPKTLRTMGGRPSILIDVFHLSESEITTIDVPDSLIPAFKELIFRATNLWPDAPPEIKHFADKIIHGKPLQDYFLQAKDQQAVTGDYHLHPHQCSCGHITICRTKNPEPPDYKIGCTNENVIVDMGEGKAKKIIPCKRLELFKKQES